MAGIQRGLKQAVDDNTEAIAHLAIAINEKNKVDALREEYNREIFEYLKYQNKTLLRFILGGSGVATLITMVIVVILKLVGVI